MPKIAVYTIAKNERKFVDKFVESCSEADMIIVTDTGSTDGTQERLRELGAVVLDKRVEWPAWPEKSRKKWRKSKIGPWRFDVARNFSLAAVPDDYEICISLDLDEVLSPGWRKALEKVWAEDITRVRYKYTWSRLADGTPDVQYWGEKIHRNKCYEWRHPVHECLYFIGKGRKEKEIRSKVEINHYPDPVKSRGNYMPLLEVANFEDPDNDRNAHYLGREYFFKRQHLKAIKELKRHLALKRAIWAPERSASMRYIAKCCRSLNVKDEIIPWLLRACAESPGEREPWIDLAQEYYNSSDYLGCYYAAQQALKITKRPENYITNAAAWGGYVYDLAGSSAFYIGLFEKSLEYTILAHKAFPLNERVTGNLKMIRNKLGRDI